MRPIKSCQVFNKVSVVKNMIPPFLLQDSDFWFEVKATMCADSTGEEFYFPAAHCFILYRSKATERLVGIVSLTYSFDSEYSGIIPEYFGSIGIFRNIPEYSNPLFLRSQLPLPAAHACPGSAR